MPSAPGLQRNVVFDEQPDHDPVLHLLLDVGFQRIGDLAWAAGDMQARGFLLGGTAGRTTLNGEGLQHEDGHSHILSSTIPNCVSYDPTFAHELAVIMQHGLKRMVENQENVFYYLTVMNENYAQPGLVKGDEEGIIRGMYQFRKGGKGKVRAQLLGSGTILREVIAAADLLESDWVSRPTSGASPALQSCVATDSIAIATTSTPDRQSPGALRHRTIGQDLRSDRCLDGLHETVR